MSEEDLSAAECQSRIEQFTQITQTDEALAQFYLQSRNWDVEVSIAAFFETNEVTSEDKSSGKRKKLDEPESNQRLGKRTRLNVSDSLKSFIKEQMDPVEKVIPEKLSFISWNIDGLDDRNQTQRTMAVASIIQTRKVDIIFLQELVSKTYDILRSKLSAEYFFTEKKTAPAGVSSDKFYYTAVLLKRSTVNLERVDVEPFENSCMFRDLALVYATLQNGMKLMLMNTHLESTKDYAKARMEQLKEAFNIAKKLKKDCTVILAGDMNARDSEVDKVGIPNEIKDLWVSLGQRKECQYTWDTMRNTNLQMAGKFKPRCRFDRVYFRPSAAKDVTPLHFGLCGIEKVSGMQCFPSDHWGIYCIFDIKKGSNELRT